MLWPKDVGRDTLLTLLAVGGLEELSTNPAGNICGRLLLSEAGRVEITLVFLNLVDEMQ